MFDFGEDLVIDNYRIHWLIWIQILVMFLLTLAILLAYFGFFAIDSSGDSITSSSPPPRLELLPTCSQRIQEEISTSNNTRGVENNSAPAQTSRCFFHPCRYIDLAKQAFLNCLGLGSAFQNSPGTDKQYLD